jgi:hypothetical protein
VFCIGESGFYTGREVTKRAESSSFAKGRLEPKAASMVTLVTQDFPAVILEQKSYTTLKALISRALNAKDRSLRQLLHWNSFPVGAAAGCDLFASGFLRDIP